MRLESPTTLHRFLESKIMRISDITISTIIAAGFCLAALTATAGPAPTGAAVEGATQASENEVTPVHYRGYYGYRSSYRYSYRPYSYYGGYGYSYPSYGYGYSYPSYGYGYS